jgi:coenzyme F420-reducing hydrogenase beta subunit
MILNMIEKSACTGCAACFDALPGEIEMRPDEEGFLYPYFVDGRTASSPVCERVCHAFQGPKVSQREPMSYIAWNKDESTREASSSGGIFTALAEKTLAEGGVVVGASFDASFHLRHTIAHNREEYLPMRGSKYVQSDTRGIYRQTQEILEKGTRVLFTGVPCQVSALYHFLGRGYDNLLTCDVFCHGEPSPGIFADYIAYLEKKQHSPVADYQFRSKALGWKKMSVSVSYANRKNKKYRVMFCPFHAWYGLHLSLRPACFQCPFRTLDREADLTIGDFWGIEAFRPGIDLSKGISALLANSEKGLSVLGQLQNQLYMEPCPIDWVLKKNKYLVKNYPLPAQKATFIADYNSIPIEKLIQKYPPATYSGLVVDKVLRTLHLKRKKSKAKPEQV